MTDRSNELRNGDLNALQEIFAESGVEVEFSISPMMLRTTLHQIARKHFQDTGHDCRWNNGKGTLSCFTCDFKVEAEDD